MKLTNPCNKCIVKVVCNEICDKRNQHGKYLNKLNSILHIGLFIQPLVFASIIVSLNLDRAESILAILLSAIIIGTSYYKLTSIIDKHRNIYERQINKTKDYKLLEELYK